MADQNAIVAGRFEVRPTASDHFAWVRTRLSLERTMMSWVRTAVALIGFGFAIVQYLNHLQQMSGAGPAYLPEAPRYLGLALIACGILALVISIWQYRWGIRQGLRMKIAEIFDGMEFGVVRGVFLRSGGPHVGEDFGGRILGLGRSPLSRQDRAPAD